MQKATGSKEFFPSEQYPYAQGGTICSVPGAELVVLSGADSWKRFDKMLETTRRKDEPRKSISGVGERAYAMYPKPTTASSASIRRACWSRNEVRTSWAWRSMRARQTGRVDRTGHGVADEDRARQAAVGRRARLTL